MKAYIKKRTFGGQMPILCSPDLVQEGQQHWGISGLHRRGADNPRPERQSNPWRGQLARL